MHGDIMGNKLTPEQWINSLVNSGMDLNNDEGISVRQLTEITNRGKDWVRARLKEAIQADLAEYLGDRKDISIDGRPRSVPVYKIKKPKAKVNTK